MILEKGIILQSRLRFQMPGVELVTKCGYKADSKITFYSRQEDTSFVFFFQGCGFESPHYDHIWLLTQQPHRCLESRIVKKNDVTKNLNSITQELSRLQSVQNVPQLMHCITLNNSRLSVYMREELNVSKPTNYSSIA